MRYEIEQAGAGHEHGPDVGTHAEPARWHVVNVLNADAVPMPLTGSRRSSRRSTTSAAPRGRSGSWRWTTTASACRWTRGRREARRAGPVALK